MSAVCIEGRAVWDTDAAKGQTGSQDAETVAFMQVGLFVWAASLHAYRSALTTPRARKNRQATEVGRT
jgi:hypothetical protein